MKMTDFVQIVLSAGQETAQELKTISDKMSFYLKVVVSILAAGDVKLELEDGLRDLKVKQVVADVRERLKVTVRCD